MRILDVNTDELVKFSNLLEKVNKKDLPKVTANTLNALALNVKKKTLPIAFNTTMIARSKNFAKANTTVNFARKTGNINSMKSEVGWFSKKETSGMAVKDMLQQDQGGIIKGKSFIPLSGRGKGKGARISGQFGKRVRKINYLSKIKNKVESKDMSGSSEKQRFFQAVFTANDNGYVLSEKGILWRVVSTSGKKPKLEALYSYEKGRNTRVRKRQFMKKAADRTSKRSNSIFIKEAKKQFDFRL